MAIFCISLYFATAFFFALRTYAEGLTSKEGGPILRAIGLLLCLVWPAVVFCAAIEVARLKRRSNLTRMLAVPARVHKATQLESNSAGCKALV